MGGREMAGGDGLVVFLLLRLSVRVGLVLEG
jgi:hypothetical protein